MINAVYAAAIGSRREMARLDVIANNLANVGTAGFREDKPFFKQLTQFLGEGDNGGGGTSVNESLASVTVHRPGALRQTGNSTDIAIQGDGFFVVQDENGKEGYTRCGAFRLDGEGRLVTMDGSVVQGEGGEILVTEGELIIDSGGNIIVNGDISDRLKIVDFDNKNMLSKIGKVQFSDDQQQAGMKSEDVDYTVVQGAIEESNVNPIKQMVLMIDAGRNYEAYQRIMKMVDQTNENAATSIAKV